MTLQSNLLDLTCTHSNSLHATDCKNCALMKQLIETEPKSKENVK